MKRPQPFYGPTAVLRARFTQPIYWRRTDGHSYISRFAYDVAVRRLVDKSATSRCAAHFNGHLWVCIFCAHAVGMRLRRAKTIVLYFNISTLEVVELITRASGIAIQ